MPTRPLGHHSVRQPIRLLHLLDGLLTQASLTAKSSGVNQRRQRQRLELTQRLLDPLPEQLAPAYRQEVLFWRGLRWATAGLLLAWILKR
ncbi:hypothetical protein KBY72_00625 [Cyanobium sp. BA5m-21]|jgi:hypothetical protein|uniref:hypothetical protein n=1 Tax=unclassified Cyanobium TaxID=2627006 RepID=UPI0020CFDD1E|nr:MULTISPECIES: hypothetical protein [unclassified Cyanobium]MCP9902950.1 hypothetical protein [Cyanobium sp. BA5m-10]MCP9905688.1 hypothetical protein [Cyanobium sp. BA5m-21]